MSPAIIFNIDLVLGYACWLLCWPVIWPRLRALERMQALRLIAMLHSFRFFGLVFLLPGVVGPHLPPRFATFAAYGDFATALLALLALLSFRWRLLFGTFTILFNLAGSADLIGNYYHGVMLGLPQVAGELGAAYAIPILFVPILMITHVAAFALLSRPARQTG
jgi:hypothetical protein